jgi:exonuclease SbcD
LAFRLLHTSDWHLGRRLYGRSRHAEQAAFLHWLTQLLDEEGIDLLIVAGDIFDSTTPSHRSLALYYRFLYQAAQTACRHIVIIGGNHDAPALLEAPKALLAQLDVHVVGRAAEQAKEEVLRLKNGADEPEAIVCAVPYLRDREVRTSSTGESAGDKQRLLLAGIGDHYARVLELARDHCRRLAGAVPLIATGHLFAAGGSTRADDGVRELYVGALVRVDAALFGDDIDYLALGHLHSSQRVAGEAHLRYSGAPLAMSFAEAGRSKGVLICEWSATGRRIREVEVPCFQALERVTGDLAAIQAAIEARVAEKRPLWVEVVYTGEEIRTDLGEILHRLTANSPVAILRIRNQRRSAQLLSRSEAVEDLEDLSPEDVFARCLEVHEIDPEARPELTTMFAEVLQDLLENSAGEGPLGLEASDGRLPINE